MASAKRERRNKKFAAAHPGVTRSEFAKQKKEAKKTK